MLASKPVANTVAPTVHKHKSEVYSYTIPTTPAVTDLKAIVGNKFGDEGKGKIVPALIIGDGSPGSRAGLVFRFNGGPNAGHSTVMPRNSSQLAVGGKYSVAGGSTISFKTHQAPTGILFARYTPDEETINDSTSDIEPVPCYIGHGCLVNIAKLVAEVAVLDNQLGRNRTLLHHIALSASAILITTEHTASDASGGAAGSTNQGISQAAASRSSRLGYRVADLFHGMEYAELAKTRYTVGSTYEIPAGLVPIPAGYEPRIVDGRRYLGPIRVCDTEDIMAEHAQDRSIVAEGAQGTFLDVELGTWRMCTSTKTTYIGAMDYGIRYRTLRIICIDKAYTTYVGNARFEEDFDKNVPYSGIREIQRGVGHEFGTTTGRRRCISPLNLDDTIYALRVNNATELVINKADILGPTAELVAAAVAGEQAFVELATRMNLPRDWIAGMAAYMLEHPEAVAKYPREAYELIDGGRTVSFPTWNAMLAYIIAAIAAAGTSVTKIIDYANISGDVQIVDGNAADLLA